MSERPGYDFRGRQISPATRADWRHDARPTNHESALVAILNRRIIELLDALYEAEASLAQAWADGYNHAKVEMLSEACRTCEDNGYDCHPHDRLYVVTCPGEMCATCDYRAGECL